MHECAPFFGLLFISKPMHPFARVIESIRFDVAELMLSIINFTQHIHKSIKLMTRRRKARNVSTSILKFREHLPVAYLPTTWTHFQSNLSRDFVEKF